MSCHTWCPICQRGFKGTLSRHERMCPGQQAPTAPPPLIPRFMPDGSREMPARSFAPPKPRRAPRSKPVALAPPPPPPLMLPPARPRNLTTAIKHIAYPAWFYDVKYIAGPTFYDDAARRIVSKMHAIDPSLTGSFIDYLVRHIWSRSVGIPFVDDRYQRIISEMLDDHYDPDDLEAIFPGYAIATNRERKWFVSKCEEFQMPDPLEYESEYCIPEILIASFAHSLYFGRFDTARAERMLAIVERDQSIKLHLIPAIRGAIQQFSGAVLLNPTLGIPGLHADADVIAGDCLIDIKVSNSYDPQCNHTLQLVGYASLEKTGVISRIAIMNLYYGVIHMADISHITHAEREQYVRDLATCDIASRNAHFIDDVA